MSRPPKFSADDIHAAVQHVFHAPPDALSHLPVGWSNENWRATVRGDRYLIKVGPPGSADKWAATKDAYHLVREAGIPAPELVHFEASNELVDGRVLRVLKWVEGLDPARALADAATTATFFADLAGALGILHRLPTIGFSSRLDGSAPQFAVWSDYIAWRLPSILDRVRATGAFQESDSRRIVSEIEELAAEVDAVARPALCHRDVYLDNLLATEDGHLAALLDFDGAEVWDPAVDLVKLRWLVFPHHPGSDSAFADAYPEEAMWAQRIRLAELLELLNAVPNAMASRDQALEASARTRLHQVMSS